MEWIKTVLPLVGVALGWLLAESGKIFADKRQDKRKLKKLLFFLMELRWRFAKELSVELDLDKYLVILKNKVSERFGVDINNAEFNLGIEAWKPVIQKLWSKSNCHEENFQYLSENIDKVLIDLAEIFPILAYELNGQHNIKERINRLNSYFSEVESTINEMPFDIKKWINPKLTKDLLVDLDKSIEKVAKLIDKQTLETAKVKIAKMNFKEDDNEINIVLDEYFDKVVENISSL